MASAPVGPGGGIALMEMQQVRYFVALAQTLNFTRAAEACNVTQPALTRAIQQLEHELGGPLFNRERGNSHLTELGRIMLPYLESVEEKARAAKDLAKAVKGLTKTRLKIGVMCTIGPQLVAGLLPRFQANNPDVEIQVIDDSAPQMVGRLEKGDLEIAFVGSHENLPDTLHQLPIFDEKFVILLPPNHRLTAKPEVHAADLHEQPYVNRSQCEVFSYVSQDLKSRGIEPRIVFRSPRDDWVQGIIKAGLGFGFFPESSVTNPDVVVRPLVDPEYHRTVFLATVRGRPHSAAVGAFIREARYHEWPASV